MTPTSLIVVADRGSLKAYKVNETPNRGPALQMVQAFDITDAHGRYDDKLTDEAGRFPVSDGAGSHHAGSIAERTALETENDRRICKQLSDHICRVVRREGREGWSFAAPASIHSAVVDLLPADVRDRIVEHVKSDLVKIESAKLPSYFRSLQPL
jgi:hypothetical protein